MMRGLRPIPETVLVLVLASAALVYCGGPTTRESRAVRVEAAPCAGARLDAAVLGELAQVGYSRDGRFSVLDFESGRLSDDRDSLVSGGAPSVVVSGSTLCVAGTLESSDACLAEVWRLGLCFDLESSPVP